MMIPLIAYMRRKRSSISKEAVDSHISDLIKGSPEIIIKGGGERKGQLRKSWSS